ncbi:putative reverse transcriptase domain-containing protein [Tanacetum coccineum]
MIGTSGDGTLCFSTEELVLLAYGDLRIVVYDTNLTVKNTSIIPIWKRMSGPNIKGIGVVARHGIPVSIICDRDGRFTSNFWRSFQKALGTDISVSTAFNPGNLTDRDGGTIQNSRGHATVLVVIKPLGHVLEGIHVDDKLQFIEESVEIMEREIK